MKKNVKYTIKEVLEYETGEPIDVARLLENEKEQDLWNIRKELEKAIQSNTTPKYVCYFCKQRIKLKGGRSENGHKLHFAHLKDSDECPIKTGTEFTKEEILRIKFNGAKESLAHIELKEIIAQSLRANQSSNKGISCVEVEKVFKDKAISKEWKKPDITSIYNDINLVFEIQLSTTFLSVIVARENFYLSNNTFILWVFKSFHTDETNQKFTEKDVYYSNNLNVFILDSEAIKRSEVENDLILHCYYKKPFLKNEEIVSEWKDEFISLDKLQFNFETYKVYYCDVKKEEQQLQNIIDSKKKNNVIIPKSDYIYTSKEQQFLNNFRSRIAVEYPFPTKLQTLFLSKFDFGGKLEDELFELFTNGYEANKSDKEFIMNEFRRELEERTIHARHDLLYYIALTTFYIKLQRPDNQKKIYKILKICKTILALKIKRVINYNYSNVIHIVHIILDSEPLHLDLFLKAINTYYPNEEFIKEDKSGKFQKKLKSKLANKIPQNTQHNYLIKLIFPELF